MQSDEICQNINKDLSELRKSKNLTLRDLARKCGIHYSNLCNMENNKGVPTLKTVAKICVALDAEIIIREKDKKESWNNHFGTSSFLALS